MGARVLWLSMSSMTWLSGDVGLLAGLPELRKIFLGGAVVPVFGSIEVCKCRGTALIAICLLAAASSADTCSLGSPLWR